ncbi:hypothetical protein GCM10011529_21380 [Polymorphobacter glacialis]|uniref:Ice-binding protein C-terminal domain-containing protein n=1 Tax=Sandarakinorhabdus glacialis TaxID=1614636 RepID=A0A917EAB1_9SPHN|nr:PEPxxWA-CTERM sorting domain-containing protein [Polymorphobacter glacialis]GGE14704.1 hypothetical protein GCM10011529_21380 [Polymorphobacter glacialis]
MSNRLIALAIAVPALAAPANATTWAFGGSNAQLASLAVSVPSVATLTVTALGFTPQPSALTNLSQLTPGRTIDRISGSIGVTGGANSQLDTNATRGAPREAFLISSTSFLKITGLKLSVVDLNDTLQIYGVGAGGALTSLGFNGTIASGFGGLAGFANTGTITNNVGGTTQLTFNSPLEAYSKFLFTTRVGGDVTYGGDKGQGYRLDTLSANAVPEPAAWAMLIAGFGLVGTSMRRNRRIAVVAA